jgi:GTP-sensing pleiotropic transcriptional regulator CodY
MQHSEAVATQIKARIRELQTEIEAHERALAALVGGSARSTRTTSASNGRRTRTAAPRRAPAASRSRRGDASTEAVFEALQGGVDQAAVIAKQFGVSTAVVRNRLQQLEEAGRVSRTGNRRSTRWRSHAG